MTDIRKEAAEVVAAAQNVPFIGWRQYAIVDALIKAGLLYDD